MAGSPALETTVLCKTAGQPAVGSERVKLKCVVNQQVVCELCIMGLGLKEQVLLTLSMQCLLALHMSLEEEELNPIKLAYDPTLAG